MKVCKNIMFSLALATAGVSFSSTASTPVEGDDWLHVEGNKIVDMQGRQVWLTGANWFGFNATERTLHGLWSVSLEDTVKAIAERGINLLRVPISTELLYEWSQGKTSIPNVNTAENADLVGKTDLYIFDKFLEMSKKYGIKVMLDVHSALADNTGHLYPMWYKDEFDSEVFYQSWEWVTERYANDDTIIAMDIENEPHGQPWGGTEFAKWDDSTDVNNWKYACETASKRILAINPNMLVMCEGIESYPIDGVTWTSMDKTTYYSNWWGGNLRGVRDYPIDLGEHQDQLVYSPHDYGPLVYLQPWFYEGFSKDTLYEDVWKDNWMFIHEEEIAPLLIGEWGGFMDGAENQTWMLAIRDLIIEHGLHHTFWCVNPNSGDTGGLLENDWLTWDEEKYALFEPSLWKSPEGKYIGLDHAVPLGSAETGTNVTEYYKSLSAFVDITSPTAGENYLVGSEVTLKLSTNKVDSVDAYIAEQLVASSTSNEVVISAPATEQSFTVKLVGQIENDGGEVISEITLNAVTEFMPELTISVPETVEQTRSFDISVEVEHAAGYQAEFAGQTVAVTDGSITSFVAPEQIGSYPLTVTAIDANGELLDVSETVSLDIVPLTVECAIGGETVWNSGAVYSDVKVTNIGDSSLNSWTVLINFSEEVQFSNGWNANFEQLDAKTLQVTSMSSLAVNGFHSFGFQLSHGGDFTKPTCTVK